MSVLNLFQYSAIWKESNLEGTTKINTMCVCLDKPDNPMKLFEIEKQDLLKLTAK